MKKTTKKYISTLVILAAIVALVFFVTNKQPNQNNIIDLPTNSVNSTIEPTIEITVEPTYELITTEIPIINFDLSMLPNPETYDGKEAYVFVNNNEPFFTEEDKQNLESFEIYSELDELGRCGVAYANICIELMPTEERGSIGSIKPSGWIQAKYDIVDGKYLYNRCHLIGFQLAAENANKLNLITGTRYLNIKGMLPFENMVADAVKTENIHVLYRITPVFRNNNLLADGILMEAYSVEDNGEAISFCVFALNIQPGIEINYLTGESKLK